MIKLTENFSLSEFECKCGCVMPAFVKKNVTELAENLQVLRDITGKLDLTNGYRCKKHNAEVGGTKSSQHLKGRAADVKSKYFSPSEIASTVSDLMKSEKFKRGGIGVYNTFTHLDIRGYNARWDNTLKK